MSLPCTTLPAGSMVPQEHSSIFLPSWLPGSREAHAASPKKWPRGENAVQGASQRQGLGLHVSFLTPSLVMFDHVHKHLTSLPCLSHWFQHLLSSIASSLKKLTVGVRGTFSPPTFHIILHEEYVPMFTAIHGRALALEKITKRSEPCRACGEVMRQLGYLYLAAKRLRGAETLTKIDVCVCKLTLT